MFAKLLAAVLLSVAGCSCASLPPTATDIRQMALLLEFAGPDGVGLCGGTAVAADEIESATHCFTAQPLTTINGQPVAVVSAKEIGVDRVRVKVTGITFKRWAKPGKTPSPGDRVRWHGHPIRHALLYREGHVAVVSREGLVIDATICHGDSGSGLFNDAGEMVGIVSRMSNENGCTFMLGVAP